MSERENECENDGAEVQCICCGEEVGDLNAADRERIEAMTKAFAANPDLAAKFLLMLKLASEHRVEITERADV